MSEGPLSIGSRNVLRELHMGLLKLLNTLRDRTPGLLAPVTRHLLHLLGELLSLEEIPELAIDLRLLTEDFRWGLLSRLGTR